MSIIFSSTFLLSCFSGGCADLKIGGFWWFNVDGKFPITSLVGSGQGRRIILVRGVFYLLLLAYLIFTHVALFNYAYDDAYIHFRIARNFVTYGQPYFNVEDRVKATTSTGWLIFVFTVFKIFGIRPILFSFINAFLSLLLIIISSKLIKKKTGIDLFSIDIIAASLVLIIFLYTSIGLMETQLAVLLLITGCYLIVCKRGSGFFFLSLSMFIRPELSINFFSAFLHGVRTQRISLHKIFIFIVLGAAPFIVFDLYFWGTVIPHSVTAKEALYKLDYSLFVYELVPTVVWILIKGNWQIFFAAVFVGLFLISVIIVKNYDRLKDIAFLLYFPGVVIFLIYVYKKVFIFEWYKPLFLFPILLTFVISLIPSKRFRFSYLWFFAIFCLLFLVINFYAAMGHPFYYKNFAQGARVQKYLEVGEELYRKYPDYSLLSSEVGGLGYSFKGKLYDAAGLVDPRAIKFHPMRVPEERSSGNIGAIPVGYVREVKPDIIVSYDIFAEAFLKSDLLREYRRFPCEVFTQRDMQIAKTITVWRSKYLNVFIRQDKMTQTVSQNSLLFLSH